MRSVVKFNHKKGILNQTFTYHPKETSEVRNRIFHPKDTLEVIGHVPSPEGGNERHFPPPQPRTTRRRTDDSANISIKEEFKPQSAGSRSPRWNPQICEIPFFLFALLRALQTHDSPEMRKGKYALKYWLKSREAYQIL